MIYADLLINGIVVGAMYALISLGFVLIYKASKMANFAQGEYVSYAALFVAMASNAWGFNLFFSLLFGVGTMIVMAVIINRLLMQYLIGKPPITAIMVTLGLGTFLQGLGRLIFSKGGYKMLLPTALEEPVFLFDIMISPIEVATAGVAVACIAVVSLFYMRSRTGLALRAIADDQQAASAMGINIRFHYTIVWALAGVVAVMGGTLWGQMFGFGFGLGLVGLKVFPIVIIGGLDSIVGVIIGGLAIGIMERLAGGFLDPIIGGGTSNVLPFLVLILVLMFRPHGLFGREQVERV